MWGPREANRQGGALRVVRRAAKGGAHQPVRREAPGAVSSRRGDGNPKIKADLGQGASSQVDHKGGISQRNNPGGGEPGGGSGEWVGG